MRMKRAPSRNQISKSPKSRKRLKIRYISLFSGVGGLEFPDIEPKLVCEIDPTCHPVLRKKFPDVVIHSDIRTLHPGKADIVAGGWPCQDISVAGKRAGLKGKNSGLFFHMVRVASEARAETVIAENVPNLLSMQGGSLMRLVIETFQKQGWPYVSWRILNARSFDLPQHRNRLIMVATKKVEVARNLFRPVPHKQSSVPETKAAGFYTTAGSRSLCYSVGYVPALKVGSSLSIPSPPGFHYGDVVRKATARECLLLQGFDPFHFSSVREKDIFRMMGNAVAVPVGAFAMKTVLRPVFQPRLMRLGLFPDDSLPLPRNGFHDGELFEAVGIENGYLCSNLDSIIDCQVQDRISARAATGLLRRIGRSGVTCPPDLFRALKKYAGEAPSD